MPSRCVKSSRYPHFLKCYGNTQEKNSLVLDNAKLEKIWFVLRQHIGLSNEAPMDSLNYDEFCQACLDCPLTPSRCSCPLICPSSQPPFSTIDPHIMNGSLTENWQQLIS